jgi:hypothetical protein
MFPRLLFLPLVVGLEPTSDVAAGAGGALAEEHSSTML